MSEPASQEEFVEKFNKNTTYSGRFLDTRMHMPCPFCAEPEFISYKIIEVNSAIAAGGTCKHCKRSCKGVVTETPGMVSVRMVQTGGDPPSPWVEMPKE